MILLVPLSFGFTYMMIKMARESERKAKLAKENAPKKVAEINLSQKWINWVIIALIVFQVFLNIAAYNAMLSGMKNISLLFTGIILLVFAGLFHVYRYGMSQAKTAPPPPPQIISRKRPKALVEKSTPQGQLPDKTSDNGNINPKLPKEQPSTPKIQAGSELNKDTSIGTNDLPKP